MFTYTCTCINNFQVTLAIGVFTIRSLIYIVIVLEIDITRYYLNVSLTICTCTSGQMTNELPTLSLTNTTNQLMLIGAINIRSVLFHFCFIFILDVKYVFEKQGHFFLFLITNIENDLSTRVNTSPTNTF